MAAQLIQVHRHDDEMWIDMDGTIITGTFLETGSVNVPVHPDETPRVEVVFKAHRVEVINDEAPRES